MRLVQHLLGNVEVFYKTGIYKITFTNKPEYIYIGSAFKKLGKTKSQKGFYVRLSQHLGSLKRNKHSNSFLQRVFNKHSEFIQFEIIELLNNDSDRETRESYWMEFYRNKQGCTILNLTPETKLAGRLKPFSKEKQREIALKQSIALKGKIPDNLSSLHEFSKRKVLELDQYGNIIYTFDSLKEFSEQVKINKKNLSYHLRKGFVIPRLKNRFFKYQNSLSSSERSGLKFRVINENAQEQLVNSLNDLCSLLKTNSYALNKKNVKSKTIIFKNYIICPLLKTYTG